MIYRSIEVKEVVFKMKEYIVGVEESRRVLYMEVVGGDMYVRSVDGELLLKTLGNPMRGGEKFIDEEEAFEFLKLHSISVGG